MDIVWSFNRRARLRVLPAIAVTVIGFTLACRAGRDTPDAVLFPVSSEVVGWERTAEMRTFPADKLWEYIDGGAERYIRAGVERTLALDYRYKGNTDAAAEIYVMKSPDGPKKLMESEPLGGGTEIECGEAGRLYAASLVFRRGNYFVRLVAYRSPPEVGAALLGLGSAIDSKLVQQK